MAADKCLETLLHRLNDLKQQVVQMPQRRAERMDAMLAEAAKLQRYKFLDQIPLDKAALPKVSRQEISMLAAFDIDSAAEVLAYSEKMNGLVSEPARAQILAWANACSRRFVFDPSQGTDPVDVQQVELVLQHEQDSLLDEMRVGQEELERLATELSEARKKRERDLEEERKALVAQRGLAVLLAAGGLLLCWNGLGGEGFIARCGLGALMFAVGVGIFLYMRWARWMALGACFLIIASACIVPVMLLLVVPFEGDFDGSMRVNVLWSLVALAFGTIGYKGLAYFRSEAGRLEFAAENATAQRDLFNVAAPDRKDDLLGETSASVLVSAGVWVLVLLVAELLGLGRPDWLLAHKRPERSRVAPTGPQDLAWYEVSRDPASLVGNSSPAVKNRVLPDLIPLGICYRDVASGRVLDMVYANVGGGSGYQMFHFATRARSGEMPFRRQFELRVPEPDSLLITRLRDDVPSGTEYALVDLDVNNEISEADEINNSARFTISYNPDGGLDLPACNNVRLRIVPGTGPVRTVATTDAPPDLPDMVPLGLCARSNILVGLQFT